MSAGPSTCAGAASRSSAAGSSAVRSRRAASRVDLQIFQPGVGWRVFANTRTRKSGTFTVRYHFQRASHGRFTFRIRLRPNDAYPYSRGVSRRMRVRVG